MTLGTLVLAVFLLGQTPGDPEPLSDREIEELVASARTRFKQATIDREERGKYALDVADRIDSAARAEPTAGLRSTRWNQAVALLDEFLKGDPSHPLALSIALQAGVYRWAEGHTWALQFERSPGNSGAKVEGIKALDDAIARLRRLWTETNRLPESELMAQNIRFRYAQALVDRANLEDDPGMALDLRQQALGRLRGLPIVPPLGGHVALLKARLLVEAGQIREAEQAFAEAEEQDGPGEADRVDTKVAILLADKQFDEAIAFIDRSELDRPSKDFRAVRVRARQWIDLFPGRERSEAETDAITRVRRLRLAEHPDANAALASLAATIFEPDDRDDPGLWELMAEGHLALGDVDQAVRLNQAGADHAERLGDLERAWLMRYRAAATLVRAGRTAEAVQALAPIAATAQSSESPAPADQRANGSLLYALALGRLASTPGQDGTVRASYEAALEDHIAAFPDDPTASEARWILGQLRASVGRDRDAIALWSEVPAGHARWRESRLALVETHRKTIESLLLADRTREARDRLIEARTALDDARSEATDPIDRNALDLSRAELELTPGLGSVEDALVILDRLVATEVLADRRDHARRLRIVAQAVAARETDAERNARAELEQSEPEQIVDLAARLDRAASSLSDPARRRVSAISRLLTERVLSQSNTLDPSLRARARVIRIRGQIDMGDLDGARRAAESWSGDLDASRLPAELIAPLADALDRLGLYHQAADAHRAVIAASTPGSSRWLEARYGLAVAYYRTSRPTEARRLIDGTMALHPDLGGNNDLRDRFLRLRRRLATP
ncbi:tol-pal system YbgF family protein [Tautonia rosea]|uniref:hypothetical protein n=1 Tax=Tautonia rosea TaxID=2728037 RepID=UPI0014753CA2|nr:hypothetical protein [Tautonia rosea]